MYFAFHINTDKSSQAENKEAIAAIVSLNDPDSWIADYITAAEYDDLFSEQLCNFVDAHANYSASDVALNGSYHNFHAENLCGNEATDVYFHSYHVVFNEYGHSAFEHLCDFFECNLWELAQKIVSYLKDTATPSIDAFRLVFREYAPLLVFDSFFLGWARCIHEQTDELEKLRNRDDLFEMAVEALYPYAILQTYACAYAHDPDKWRDAGKFYNIYSPNFSAHTSQPERDSLTTSRNHVLEQFMRAPKEESLYWAQEYLTALQAVPDCRKTDEHLVGCFSYCDMLFHMFRIAFEKSFRLNRCANCNKFFFAIKRTDTKYCGRTLYAGTIPVTCRTAGPNFNFENQRRNNAAIRLERQLYNLLRNRHIRHPENMEYKQAFEAFTEENRRRKAQTATTEKLLKEFFKDQEEPKSDSDHPEINNSYTAWLISELDKYKKK